MTEIEFQNLLEKYEKGCCTPQEEKLLNEFLDSFQQQSSGLYSGNQQEQQERGERILQKINQRVLTPNSSTFSLKKRWLKYSIAASVVGILVYGGNKWVQENENLQKKDVVISYSELSTDENEQRELKLSDGTLITLNENSTLKYPKTFLTEGERKVELVGEAFFEVAKDSLRPFIALSGKIETVVLGTSFNIKARPELENIEVALVEGKVRITTTGKEELEILRPNEQMIYSKKDEKYRKSIFKGNLTYAWKEEIILFDKASVREVIEVLSEKYHVDFKIEKEEEIESLLVYRVNTDKCQLSQVLEHITKVTDYWFTNNADGSITVSPRK